MIAMINARGRFATEQDGSHCFGEDNPSPRGHPRTPARNQISYLRDLRAEPEVVGGSVAETKRGDKRPLEGVEVIAPGGAAFGLPAADVLELGVVLTEGEVERAICRLLAVLGVWQ